MQITSVDVRRMEKADSRMKGTAVVVIDGCFKIRNIRIIDGDNGLFIAMPSQKKANGEFYDIAHPLDQETRMLFTEAILTKYNETELEENVTESDTEEME